MDTGRATSRGDEARSSRLSFLLWVGKGMNKGEITPSSVTTEAGQFKVVEVVGATEKDQLYVVNFKGNNPLSVVKRLIFHRTSLIFIGYLNNARYSVANNLHTFLAAKLASAIIPLINCQFYSLWNRVSFHCKTSFYLLRIYARVLVTLTLAYSESSVNINSWRYNTIVNK